MSARPALRPLAGVALRAQPDAELVTLFRDGHERAYEEIVRRYRPALVAFAGGIVPRHRAEDVVQESLLRAHSALGGENRIEVRPWLYAIVRNRALNSLRDERAHEHLAEDYDGVPQPPDVLARREDIAGLVASIKALPEAQREALVGRELEGRSHDEIAAALGATPGAVRGLIFRAREGLRNVSGLLVPPSLAELAMGPGGTDAIGLASGGAAGLLLKAGVVASVGALAVGSGVALHRHDGNDGSSAGAAVAGERPSSGGRGHDAKTPSHSLVADDVPPGGAGSARSGPGRERGPQTTAGASRQGSSGRGESAGSSGAGTGSSPQGGSSGVGAGGGSSGPASTHDGEGGSSGSDGGGSGSDGGGSGSSGSGGGGGSLSSGSSSDDSSGPDGGLSSGGSLSSGSGGLSGSGGGGDLLDGTTNATDGSGSGSDSSSAVDPSS